MVSTRISSASITRYFSEEMHRNETVGFVFAARAFLVLAGTHTQTLHPAVFKWTTNAFTPARSFFSVFVHAARMTTLRASQDV